MVRSTQSHGQVRPAAQFTRFFLSGLCRKLLSWWGGALFLLGAGGANAQPEAVELLKLEVEPGTIPVVQVRAVKGTVFLPACRGVVWHRYDAGEDAWVVGTPAPCGAVSDAWVVEEEPRAFSAPDGLVKGDVIRPVFTVGKGCQEGQPMALANCQSVHTQTGPNVTVRGPPAGQPVAIDPEPAGQ